MDEFIPILAIVVLFLGLPWLIFHYITRWKTTASLSNDDEKLLDDLHEMARRLDDRLCTIERIMTAENPTWRQTCLPEAGTTVESDIVATRTRIRSGEKA